MIYELLSQEIIIKAVRKLAAGTEESKKEFLDFIYKVAFNDKDDIRNIKTLVQYEIKALRQKVSNTAFIEETENAVNEIFEPFLENSSAVLKGKPPVKSLDWQGTQAQLVFLFEQLYQQGFLSSITQSEKFSLLSQHFTVKGESLNPRTLAQTRQNSLNTKKGKPKAVEKIEQIISAAKKQNP